MSAAVLACGVLRSEAECSTSSKVYCSLFAFTGSAMEHCYQRWSPDKSEEKNQFCSKESAIGY